MAHISGVTVSDGGPFCAKPPEGAEARMVLRFFDIEREARRQALRLHVAADDRFLLRDLIDYQLFAEARTLDEVEQAISRRQADQSERMIRLRKVAEAQTLLKRGLSPAKR